MYDFFVATDRAQKILILKDFQKYPSERFFCNSRKTRKI